MQKLTSGELTCHPDCNDFGLAFRHRQSNAELNLVKISCRFRQRLKST